MQRCSTLGYLGTHFIPITPGESPSTVNLERGGNPSWQSISFLRHAGVRSTLNSLHRANWITHDCRSISRRHASIPICWGRWICVEINRDWKWNRSNDHRNTGCFRWGSAWKTAYVAVAPLPLCTWRQHRAFWAGYREILKTPGSEILPVTSGLCSESSLARTVSSLYASNSPEILLVTGRIRPGTSFRPFRCFFGPI